MLAMQNRHVALRIVLCIDFGHLRWRGFRFGQRSPLAVADPSALLSRRSINVEEAHRFAILLQLILDVAFKCQRLGMGKIDARVIQILAVVNADGNKPAGLGMRLIAGPLEDRDSAQIGRVRLGFGDLAGILRGAEMRKTNAAEPTARLPLSTIDLNLAMTRSTSLDNNQN